MRIRRLKLSGFKSFVEPSELRIEPGLTGVVGPNGCGKSNLLEAIRWGMGEPAPLTPGMASSRVGLPPPLGPRTPVSPGSIRSSAGSTKLLNPLSFSRRKRNPLTPSLALAGQRFLELGLQLFPACRRVDQRPVD